jgi:hypothetical protein
MDFHPMIAFMLFPAMLLLLELGRRLRRRREGKKDIKAIEGAIFGLFGLLLAFTFSGAVSRYDRHRLLLTEEVNYIGTAFLRLELLPTESQPEMKQLFRDYTNSRLHLYEGTEEEISPESARLQHAIWEKAAVASNAKGAQPDAAKLLLPALNNMIDVTEERRNAFHMHPPRVVYWLLFFFSSGAALIAGYSMKAGPYDWVYSTALALAVTLTVYTILDVEYPRLGLIRLSHTDDALIQLRDSMK